MLAVRGLKARYGPVEAVKGVDLSLGPGEILAMIGANGAGKTTTIMAIMGLVRPSGGSVEFDGRAISGLPPEKIARLGIALSPEGRRVFANLTVEENLRLGGAIFCDAAELERRSDAQYARFPILGERRRQKAGLLSGGEQQMLAISRALMGAPRLLLLDEPSLGLAPKITAEIFALLAGLKAEGLSILLVEQNVAQALALADRAVVVANGLVKAEGPAAKIRDSELVRSAYMAA
jgi:branched-chain amino acid transport system ATP-binding protein